MGNAGVGRHGSITYDDILASLKTSIAQAPTSDEAMRQAVSDPQAPDA